MLISEEAIRSRIDELATEIARDYKGRKPLLIGILKGSVVFMADLIRKIDIPIEIDFMSVSSYGNDTSSSGVVRILKDLDSPITGRDVLIIEDILDSGLTLGYLTRVLGERQPKSIKICSLLYKMRSADEQLPIDISYLGFAIENEFVIGYGLDYAGFYRNLPFIGILDEKAYSNE
jgi:hypoxanthine phosphoribosyltransferase